MKISDVMLFRHKASTDSGFRSVFGHLSYHIYHISVTLLSHSLSEHCHDNGVSALCSQMAAEPAVLYNTSSRREKQQNRDR